MFAAILSALALDDLAVQAIQYLTTWSWGT
jgi:hypothetical protein